MTLPGVGLMGRLRFVFNGERRHPLDPRPEVEFISVNCMTQESLKLLIDQMSTLGWRPMWVNADDYHVERLR